MIHNGFTHALTRYPAANMGDGLTTQTLGTPDWKLAIQQYENYLDALRDCGLSVTALPADSAYPDGHFVEDAAVIYGDLTVITQPGTAIRSTEVESVAQALSHREQVCITGEGHLEGGDVLFCADRVLIGLSERTNLEGAKQLRAALQSYDASLKVDFVPVHGVLHLKTGITELTPGVLLRSPRMTTDYNFDFAEMHVLPIEEAHGANVLPINSGVMVMKGYPTVLDLAQRYYTHILEMPMSEFHKMDGSLTCLSLRYTE